MKKQTGSIKGNNNIQVIGGDYISTPKFIRRTNVIHNPSTHIDDSQAKEIQDRVLKIAKSLSAKSKYSYQEAYKSLYNRYKITSYKLLPKEKFNDAIKWLDRQIAIHRPQLKNVDTEEWRKDIYKSIHARARQQNIDIHQFATDLFEIKKPISSLKDLSDRRLKILYTKLFSKK